MITLEKINEYRNKIKVHDVFNVQPVYSYTYHVPSESLNEYVVCCMIGLFVEAMLTNRPSMYLIFNDVSYTFYMSKKGFLYLNFNRSYETRYQGNEVDMANYISSLFNEHGYCVVVISKGEPS